MPRCGIDAKFNWNINTLKLIIPIAEIPEPGLTIRGELDEDWVRDALLPAYTPVSPMRVALEVKRFGNSVHVSGECSVALEFQCSRTLKDGATTLTVPVSELFEPAQATSTKLGEGIESEELENEPWYYEEKQVNLEPLIQELFVLCQTPYPVVVERSENNENALWTSDASQTDPRWEKLKGLKLN